MIVLGIGRLHPILDCIALKSFSLFIYVRECCVFIALQAVLCRERGPLYGCVSGLLIAVVPLGAQGHWGTWASVAAGCGPNTLSGQDLEHRLNH